MLNVKFRYNVQTIDFIIWMRTFRVKIVGIKIILIINL